MSKVFNLYERRKRSFDVFVNHFAAALTFLFKHKMKIKLTFVMKLLKKMSTTVSIKPIRLNISQLSLIENVTPIISVKKIKMAFTVTEKLKASTTVLLNMPITFVFRQRLKSVTNIRGGKITMVFSPVLATFRTLGYFDPQTLGTLDTMTLGEMDYSSN